MHNLYSHGATDLELHIDKSKRNFTNTHSPEPLSDSSARDDIASAAQDATTYRRVKVALTPRFMWLVIGAVLVTLALVVLVIKALGALILIFFSIILAEAIRPLVARLQQRRIPQPLAVILIYLGAAVILGGLLWVIVNPVASQVNTLVTQLPTYITRLQAWFAEVELTLSQNAVAKDLVSQARTALLSWIQQLFPSLLNVPAALLGALLGLLINVVIVLTMSLFWLGSSARFKEFILGLVPHEKRHLVSTVTGGISRGLGGWVLGTLIAMFLIGSFTALGLLIVGAPYALLLGILAGLTELVPYLGPWISGSVAAVVTLATTRDPLTVLWVIIVFLIIQEVEGNVVEPLVMNKAVKLDPWLVIVAILIGGELLGLIGVILAVPLAAVAQVIVLEVVAPAIRLATNPPGDGVEINEQASDHHLEEDSQ